MTRSSSEEIAERDGIVGVERVLSGDPNSRNQLAGGDNTPARDAVKLESGDPGVSERWGFHNGEVIVGNRSPWMWPVPSGGKQVEFSSPVALVARIE